MTRMTIAEWRKGKTTKKGSKYLNKKTDGNDSKKESRRERELRMLERTSNIRNLRTQVPFTLIPAQHKQDGTTEKSCQYIADFVYETSDGRTIVEDTKSAFTKKLPVYVIKRKLMLQVHGIEILET